MLPILQKMENKSNVGHVIRTSYTVITAINIAFASIALILYINSVCVGEGNNEYNENTDSTFNNWRGPCSNILGNVSNGNYLIVIKLFICTDLLFTVPLVMSASREKIEDVLEDVFGNIFIVGNGNINIVNYALRISLTVLVVFFALQVPDLSSEINVVGMSRSIYVVYKSYTVLNI